MSIVFVFLYIIVTCLTPRQRKVNPLKIDIYRFLYQRQSQDRLKRRKLNSSKTIKSNYAPFTSYRLYILISLKCR